MTRPSTALERVLIAGTALATLALAGCSESGSPPSRALSPDAPSLDKAPPELADENGRHMFRPKDYNDKNADNGARVRPNGGGTGINYHGGPLLTSSTKVAAVYWAADTIFRDAPKPPASGPGSEDGSLVGYFLSHLTGSDYFNINTTYYDGAGTHVANVVNYTQYWANNANAPSGTQKVTDAQMLQMLESGFGSGALTYDRNTLYAIFTSGKVNLGGGFGTQYCAYHTHGTVSVPGQGLVTVLYAAMPYNYAYPSACTSGYAAANGDPGADYEVNTLVHEIEETTTDEMANAWYDTRGYENADKCAWTWGTRDKSGGNANITLGSKNFLVQQNWVNAGNGGCVKSY